MAYDVDRFAEKFRLALLAASEYKPEGGLCGIELEWNLLDSFMRPLLTVGSTTAKQSFVDYLRAECLPTWIRDYSQLEVFHWMIEWATRPYYTPRGAIYESRLLEGALINALNAAGKTLGEPLYYWHGNLLYQTDIGNQSIPGSWNLAKRRYLERCVALYGEILATAGTHSNLSLPEPLLAWDFLHLPASERRDIHLDEYKSEFYITATRWLRAFAALFIATSASTPLQAQNRHSHSVVILTNYDSVRNLIFPNPIALDEPDLYRSYADYLRASYDLARRGVRFGNNNWTPVRARSFAEPVERLIAVTSDQLNDLYARGLYSIGNSQSEEEMARQIEIQNLLARINLPMARVEVRTDDGGHSLFVDIANLTLKYLLMLRFYADREFARAFRYDREDISRARQNEESAAKRGLDAEIEHPFSGKPILMREFLRWLLKELKPLAIALGMWDDLTPLIEMGEGAPNTANKLRVKLINEFEIQEVVPVEVLRDLADERCRQVSMDIEQIAQDIPDLEVEKAKLEEFFQHARDSVRHNPQTPIQFWSKTTSILGLSYPDVTSEILDLSQKLIRIPSITACQNERLDDVRRAADFIFDYLGSRGLNIRYFRNEKYPALFVEFPGQILAPVTFSGHFDVVQPDPDESQFEARIEGDFLWGRGSADMKTVVATFLVWLKDEFLQGPPYPPINLLLVGNEENGELEPMGTPHVLKHLVAESQYNPALLIAGERTGESGKELWGEICIENRGVMRFDIQVHGFKSHSGVAGAQVDLTERLMTARQSIHVILREHLTLSSADGWQSQVRFPFLHVGTPGIYNILPDIGVLGVEIRSIPQDDLGVLEQAVRYYCQKNDFEMVLNVMENGIRCDPSNPYLLSLIQAVQEASGITPVVGKKLPGTSARFAPRGQGIVWGQSGINPHARDEMHFIPSIEPYYRALRKFASRLKANYKG